MMDSHKTRWGWCYPSGIRLLQEHLQPRGREDVASSLPTLALLIILPREEDTAGEKSCLGSIPGV